jgi:type IX secretion system PorP/SprF family membrane protein
LYLGPSFAGGANGSRITAQYRNQWFDLGAKFITYSASYDHYFSSFNSGIGVNFLSDVAGTSQIGVIQAGLHYSYNFQIFNIWQLRPGISFSYLEHGVYGKVRYIDQVLSPIDTAGTSGPRFSVYNARDVDAGSSLLLFTEGFWLGVTVDHLLEPNVSLHSATARIPMKTSVYGGIDFRAKGKLLKPSDDMLTFAFLYKQQENIRQLDVGAYWYSYPVTLGVWYRGIPTVSSHRGEAVVFLIGIKTRNFNIGYSYDLTISNLLAHTKGSHEVSLSYKFLLPRKPKMGAVPCPEF